MIYFINLPFDGQDDRKIQSLGAAYLAAELVEQNMEVRIFDGCGVDREKSRKELYEELIHTKPKYIGFYVIEHNYDITVNFINQLAKVIEAIIFLGGPQVNFLAEHIMEKEKNIDFVLVGESEGKLGRILEGDFSVNGLIYRKDDNIIKNSMLCDNCDLNDLHFPIRKIDNKCFLTKEVYKGKDYYIVPISSSRGCPYKCSFCSVPAMVSNQNIKWRFRSAENIGREIQQIYNVYNRIYVRFIDDNFLVNIDRALCVCEKIRDMGDIPFSFSGRVDKILTLTDEQIEMMKSCGVTAIEVGVENFNEHVLERYRKNVTVAQTKDALRKLLEHGIYPGIDFIMFDPWTTLEDLTNNYQTIVELGLDNYNPPFLTNRLYPFPGSEYYNNKSVDMDNYFIHSDVDKVYRKMIQFMEKYKTYRLYLQNSNDRTFATQIFLRLPYKVFEYLIHNPSVSLDDIKLIEKFEYILYGD